MNRREVIEHLVYVLGVREPAQIRRLTREYLAYWGRRSCLHSALPERSERGAEVP